MNEVEVRSWAHLADLIADATKDAGHRLFRGVTSRKHLLVPKIGRPGSRKDPSDGTALPHSEDIERRALLMFQRTARSLVTHEPRTNLEWLSVAQHFGAPTRLLDWSMSPLVAAYFALEKAGTGGIPAIYVLDPPRTVTEKEAEDPFALGEVVTYLPPHISPRIQVQRSVFTVHPCPGTEFAPSSCTVWCLPQGSPAFELKRIVDACGFNRASLYPDIGGLAEYVGWCYKWGTVVDA